MKAKKPTKHPAQASIDSHGIVKKKKTKSLAHKLSASSELTEAMGTAAATATTLLSPKNNIKKRKKNKKNNSQKPSNSAANGLSSNTKNGVVNSQKSPGNTGKTSNAHLPIETTLNGASSHIKKTQNKNQVTSQPSSGNLGSTDSTSDSQRATGAVKKSKKRAKRNQTKGELPRTPETNKENEQKTIFVGNVSTKTTRKSLTRFFSKYGKVETVRLRCAAVPTPATTKKQAVIMNNFHEKRTSLCAYVRFADTVMVEAALKANGTELDQKHLQVDRSQGSTERNTKLAVFIGNLAFEAEEEDLRSHFASCGEIESVRIVRDKKMASGKGFGYINFVSEDAVEMALQLNDQVFMHRQLRVQRCTKQGKKGMKPRFKTGGKKGLTFMKTKHTSPKTTKSQQSFSGKKMMETKKFKKMKAKAKFTKEDRKKKAIAHKLAGGKPKKTTS